MPAIAPLGADGLHLRFEIEGHERASVGISRYAKTIQDFRPFWRQQVAPWFFDLVQQGFASQGAPPVGRWEPLSKPYAAWKARRYPGRTILRRSDTLIQSLTWRGAQLQGRGGVATFHARAAELGTAIPYARFHQRGTRRMPARRFLYLPPDASRVLGRMLARWAHAQATGLGRSGEAPSVVQPGPGGGLL